MKLNAMKPTGRLGLSVREAAETLGLCEKTLLAHVNAGTIPAKRVGRRIIISVEALRAWLAEPDTTTQGGSDATK